MAKAGISLKGFKIWRSDTWSCENCKKINGAGWGAMKKISLNPLQLSSPCLPYLTFLSTFALLYRTFLNIFVFFFIYNILLHFELFIYFSFIICATLIIYYLSKLPRFLNDKESSMIYWLWIREKKKQNNKNLNVIFIIWEKVENIQKRSDSILFKFCYINYYICYYENNSKIIILT